MSFSGAPMEYEGDGDGAAAGGGKRETNNSLTPLTVRLLEQLTHSAYEGKFMIGNRTIQHVSVLGQVMGVEWRASDHCLLVTLQDDGGSISVTKIVADEDTATKEMEAIKPSTYVRVIGRVVSTRSSPFASADERQLSAFSITPLRDHNQLTQHCLHIIASALAEQVGMTRTQWDQSKSGLPPIVYATQQQQQQQAPMLPSQPMQQLQYGGMAGPAAPQRLPSQPFVQQQGGMFMGGRGQPATAAAPRSGTTAAVGGQPLAVAGQGDARWQWLKQRMQDPALEGVGVDCRELASAFKMTPEDTRRLFEQWTSVGWLYCTVDDFHFKGRSAVSADAAVPLQQLSHSFDSLQVSSQQPSLLKQLSTMQSGLSNMTID